MLFDRFLLGIHELINMQLLSRQEWIQDFQIEGAPKMCVRDPAQGPWNSRGLL